MARSIRTRLGNLRSVAFGCSVLIAPIAVPLCTGCSADATAGGPSEQAGDVRVVEQAEFDELRRSGRYTISDPRGEITAREACVSGTVDAACIDAARERLRKTAAERDSNLVLLRDASVLQSQPPQYLVTGVLYQIRSRP